MTAQLSPYPPPAEPRRWTVEEYHKAAESVFRPGERLELVRGEIIQKVPQSPAHSSGVRFTAKALERCAGRGFEVRQQMPVTLLDDSEPEPDILVARGTTADFTSRHPHKEDTMLIVEVSDSTLRYDKTSKAALYAQHGIPEVWVLNLDERLLEVHREPASLPGALFGAGYRSIMLLTGADAVTPLALPACRIHVAKLLPPAAQ